MFEPKRFKLSKEQYLMDDYKAGYNDGLDYARSYYHYYGRGSTMSIQCPICYSKDYERGYQKAVKDYINYQQLVEQQEY